MEPKKLLRHFGVPGSDRVFALGALESRVNLKSQQYRAFNLAYALVESGSLGEGAEVAVVGAGVAGLTAAAALGQLGVRATVLEKSTEPLQLIGGCTTRGLSPNILDWPNSGWQIATTHFPLMNWSAGSADRVAKDLRKSWEGLAESLPVALHCGAKDVQLEQRGGDITVTWNSPAFRSHAFDAAVLAVGFGLEKDLDALGLAGYWRDDDLHQHQQVPEPPSAVFISGCGDGGLADLQRAALGVEGMACVLELLLKPSFTEALKPEIARIETIAEGERGKRSIWDLYRDLPESPVDTALDQLVRQDTTTVLHGRNSDPLASNAYPLNKYIASRLLRHSTHYSFGPLEIEQAEGRYLVSVNEGRTRTYDRLVIRHGPVPALESDFPSLWKAINSRRALAELDETRYRHWPEAYFSREVDPTAPGLADAVFVARLGVSPSRLPRPKAGYGLTIISGLSASGKDALVQAVLEKLQLRRVPIQVLPKISTRSHREYEPDHFRAVTEERFRLLRQQGEILAPYRWASNHYGFSLSHLISCMESGTPQVCVFTKVNLVPAVIANLKRRNVPCQAIFIEATPKDCKRRTLLRNFNEAEAASRIQSIDTEVQEIKARENFRSEYIFIDNSDASAFADASSRLADLVESLYSTSLRT